jgi:hypothetical protein
VRAATAGRRQLQALPVQLLKHAPAQDCAQKPPEQPRVQLVVSPHPWVQAPPEQLNVQVAPSSHVCVQ